MLSFSNLSDWCTQLRQIIRCLAMQALVHCHPKVVCDSICHLEPMQLRVKQVCQAVVVLLRAAHNLRCSVHDPLQLIGNRLWCSGQQQIVIVDPGRNKGVNQYGCKINRNRDKEVLQSHSYSKDSPHSFFNT